MQRHGMKTRQQLANLIVAHTREAKCEICDKELGKLVVIPVDSPEDSNVLVLCDDCYVEHILRVRITFYARLTRWIRTLKEENL